jgi:hypothetical protein
MPYVAIPSQLKNVDSVSLELMSPEEMKNMSYGEVLTAETINYRSGTPQMNGLGVCLWKIQKIPIRWRYLR